MDQPILTVAIPTYNRKACLLSLMSTLLPQLDGRTVIDILDNRSESQVSAYIDPVVANYPNASVRVTRNRYNIGANANILRCFERCETPWIWVVGDDDDLETDALTKIHRRIEAHPDALLLNFPIDAFRTSPRLARGLEEFCEAIDRSADVPWIASTVYRVEDLTPNLRFGYQYAFSMLPHVALLLMSYRPEHVACFCTERIAGRDRAGAATGDQTPIVNMALGFPTLLDLPIDLEIRRKLVRKLLVTNDSPGLPLRQLAYQLLLMSMKGGNRRDALYTFDQACRRRFYFERTLKERAEVMAYRVMLSVPPSWISWAYSTIKRRPMVRQTLQDRTARL